MTEFIVLGLLLAVVLVWYLPSIRKSSLRKKTGDREVLYSDWRPWGEPPFDQDAQ